LLDATVATLAQRAATHVSAHTMALAAQTVTLAVAGAAKAKPTHMAVASMVSGGLTALVGKEVVGEFMKMRPSLGATITLPSETVPQREGPRVMAGLNDMVMSIAGGLSGAVLASKLTPVLAKEFEKQGLSQPMALAMAMSVTAAGQRLISAVCDTASDVASTLLKGTVLPGRGSGNSVNAKFDTNNMAAGMLARLAINFSLTLPMGVPVALGKMMTSATAMQKASVSNAMAWAGMNGWIVAKAHIKEALDRRGQAAARPNPPARTGDHNV
jgi:hypothetical protein